MYGRVYTCFVQLGLSQNLGQEKLGGGGTLENVCYPAMCIPLCGIFFTVCFLFWPLGSAQSDLSWGIMCGAHGKHCSGKSTISTHCTKLRWRNYSSLLFRSGLSSTPNYGKVFYNYGNSLRDQERKKQLFAIKKLWGKIEEILKAFFSLFLRLWPSYVIAPNNLATVTDNETDIENLLL